MSVRYRRYLIHVETSSALLRTFRDILLVKQSKLRPHLHRSGSLKSRIDTRCATALAIMALTPTTLTFNSEDGKWLSFTHCQGHKGLDLELRINIIPSERGWDIPYILESNLHPFYSFRGLKNQMRIRFAVESWILEK